MILLELIIYDIYLMYIAYYYIDQIFILSEQGSKIKKYMLNNNIDINKVEINKENIIIDTINIIKNDYILIVISLCIAIIALIIKFIITHEFLFSSFFIVHIFSFDFELNNILANNYYLLKINYYTSSYIILFVVVYKIMNTVKNKFSTKNTIISNESYEKNNFNIGIDKSSTSIYLPISGMYQNIMITGSIGSGKTSSIISNITDYLLKNKMSRIDY